AAVAKTAKVGGVHQANVAGLRAVNDHDIVLIQLLALVDEFHGRNRSALKRSATIARAGPRQAAPRQNTCTGSGASPCPAGAARPGSTRAPRPVVACAPHAHLRYPPASRHTRRPACP